MKLMLFVPIAVRRSHLGKRTTKSMLRLSEIFWIVGSSPTMTNKNDRLDLLLGSIVTGLSFPT